MGPTRNEGAPARAAHDETEFDEILAPVHHARRIAAIVLVALGAIVSYLGSVRAPGIAPDAIGLIAALAGGWPIWMEAWEAIREREINMEITMALGVVAALVVQQYSTAAFIAAFTLFSMYLEDLTKSRGRRALEALLEAAPRTATVQRGGEWITTAADRALVGERILVRPGERIATDGHVVEGESQVVEAAITGEPFPQDKTTGSFVYAGTVNGHGRLIVQCERAHDETTYSRIVALVREASERRGKKQRLADRLAQAIVYVVLAAAAITYIVSHNATTAVSVILVAGACGVAAGTPLAILATTARGARQGVVLKGGEAVEALASVDMVVFDKTGTLTTGEPTVDSFVPLDGTDGSEVLRYLHAMESSSDHPLAKAVTRFASERHPAAGGTGRAAEGVQYLPGRGLRARIDGTEVVAGNLSLVAERGAAVPDAAREIVAKAAQDGNRVVLCAVGGVVRAGIVLRDALRPRAEATVAALKARGLRVCMLTGDDEAPARRIGAEVGIDEVHANLSPADKLGLVRAWQSEGRKVAFVGDGINDTPAIAEATAGIAMRSGSDAAVEACDVLLVSNDISDITLAFDAGRRAQRVILFNFGGTLAVDGVGILLAAAGFLTPLPAAIVHVGSELAFILNSARLFGWKWG
ncbi:MAG: heavy metal translocating P-type ATPase [Thermoplasmatota archaeon]